ncbi:MAG: hypothetical protein ACU843_01460 [Gammaproteobacteria bacterium]
MKTKAKHSNRIVLQIFRLAGFVLLAFLVNLGVAQWFGGVNPLLEFSTGGISKIESAASKNTAGLGAAYQICKAGLVEPPGTYEFPDESYEAWDLSEGRFLIESRVYQHSDSGLFRVANLLCRVLKTEDNDYLAVHWEIQGIQVKLL